MLAARSEWERLKVRIPEIEGRLAEMAEPDFVWTGERFREHEALEEELEDLIALAAPPTEGRRDLRSKGGALVLG
jgi:hypothetical protein